MTIQEQKHQAFLKDLKEVLKKHKAELVVEEFDARSYTPGHWEMVVEFEFDEKQFDIEGSGITEVLRLGSFQDAK